MPQLLGLRDLIELPPVPVAKGGVLNAARVIPTTGHALIGAEYETMACSDAHQWFGDPFCPDPSNPKKLFDQRPSMVEGDPFVVQAGVDCELGTMADNESRARQALAYSERREVDYAIYAFFQAEAEVILPNPGSILEAIGICEDAIVRRYGGEGMIYIPVTMIPLACQNGAIASTLDGRLMTCQGTPVANIASPSNQPENIWVSGAITLLQGPIEYHTVPPAVGCADADFAPARALAERIYVPLIECAIGGITFVE